MSGLSGGRVCHSCRGVITDPQCISACGVLFHTQHFECDLCRRGLVSGQFARAGEQIVCTSCSGTLKSCFVCSQPISSAAGQQIVGIDEETFAHVGCFACSTCRCSLVGVPMQTDRPTRQFFCQAHAQVNRVGPAYSCVGCGDSIVDRVLVALENHWHSRCFVCAQCLEPLEGKSFTLHEPTNSVYCARDYRALFAPKCFCCGLALTGSAFSLANAPHAKFHPHCLKCTSCQLPLQPNEFFQDPTDPTSLYCQAHFEKYFLTPCHICRQVIHGGDALKVCGRTIHRGCFVCRVCSCELASCAYDEQQGSFYCEKHIPGDAAHPEGHTQLHYLAPAPSPLPSVASVTASTSSGGSNDSDDDDDVPPPPPSAPPSAQSALASAAELTQQMAAVDLSGDTDQSPDHTNLCLSLPTAIVIDPVAMVAATVDPATAPPPKLSPSAALSAAHRLIQAHPRIQLENGIVPPSQLPAIISLGIKATLADHDSPQAGHGGDFMRKELHNCLHSGISYRFQDYAPQTFASLRRHYGISHESYMQSLVHEGIYGGSVGDGKSGMLFYFSRDGQYVIKTVKREELRFFRTILGRFVTHVCVSQPHSLLPRFFGVYKLSYHVVGGEPQTFRMIVMNNLFDVPPQISISQKFDLKGSTRNRKVPSHLIKPGRVLLDLNFNEMNLKIRVGQKQKQLLMDQIRADCEFLRSANIMDHSLLIGIHYDDISVPPDTTPPLDPRSFRDPLRQNPEHPTGPLLSVWQRAHGGLRAYDPSSSMARREVYFLGIIDILQEFNTKKAMESAYKIIRFNKNAISAIESRGYNERFVQYMASVME